MVATKGLRPEKIDKLMQAIKSPIELPPGAAEALAIIEESQSRSRAIAGELAKQQEVATARISAQL